MKSAKDTMCHLKRTGKQAVPDINAVPALCRELICAYCIHLPQRYKMFKYTLTVMLCNAPWDLHTFTGPVWFIRLYKKPIPCWKNAKRRVFLRACGKRSLNKTEDIPVPVPCSWTDQSDGFRCQRYRQLCLESPCIGNVFASCE